MLRKKNVLACGPEFMVLNILWYMKYDLKQPDIVTHNINLKMEFVCVCVCVCVCDRKRSDCS